MPLYPVGTQVRSLIPNIDTDEHDNERYTPAGAVGRVTAVDGPDADGDYIHQIIWSGGGWTAWLGAELHDPAQAEILRYPSSEDA
jgi:hypothetical protein